MNELVFARSSSWRCRSISFPVGALILNSAASGDASSASSSESAAPPRRHCHLTENPFASSRFRRAIGQGRYPRARLPQRCLGPLSRTSRLPPRQNPSRLWKRRPHPQFIGHCRCTRNPSAKLGRRRARGPRRRRPRRRSSSADCFSKGSTRLTSSQAQDGIGAIHTRRDRPREHGLGRIELARRDLRRITETEGAFMASSREYRKLAVECARLARIAPSRRGGSQLRGCGEGLAVA